jgi:hypothetical protein
MRAAFLAVVLTGGLSWAADDAPLDHSWGLKVPPGSKQQPGASVYFLVRSAEERLKNLPAHWATGDARAAVLRARTHGLWFRKSEVETEYYAPAAIIKATIEDHRPQAK